MAVLHGFAVVLTVVILKQKVRHPNQKMSKQLVSYFEVICALLSNFTLRHLKTGKLVDCTFWRAFLFCVLVSFYPPVTRKRYT